MLLNGAQLHLLLNHLPILGCFFAAFTLLCAMFSQGIELKRYALVVTFLAGISSLGAYYTGGPAAGIAKTILGVDKTLIGPHAEMGEIATVLALITVALAGLALLIQVKNINTMRKSIPLVFLFSVMTACVLAYAGHLGGKIHHPELYIENPEIASPPEQ